MAHVVTTIKDKEPEWVKRWKKVAKAKAKARKKSNQCKQ